MDASPLSLRQRHSPTSAHRPQPSWPATNCSDQQSTFSPASARWAESASGLWTASHSLENEIPQLFRRIAVLRLRGGPTDGPRKHVEHDRLEHDAGDPPTIEVGADGTGCGRLTQDLLEEGNQRTERPRRLGRLRGKQVLGELRQGPWRTLPFALPPRFRSAQPVVLDDEIVKAVDGLVVAGNPLVQMLGGRPHRLFEQGQEKLLLPAEVLVETPQRLAGALNHFLDSELLARGTLAHEVHCRVEKPLHPVFSTNSSGVEGTRHSLIAPCGHGHIGRRLVCRHGCDPSRAGLRSSTFQSA